MEAQIRNRIIETLQHFDLFQLLEILNFVEYLGNKKKRPQRTMNHIDLLIAKYSDILSMRETLRET